LNRNDYYSDFRCLSPEESLTCVIGAKGSDGCVIVSDTREVIGSEHRDVSKIRVLWDDKGAFAGAGDAPLIAKVVETINRISTKSDSDKIKDIDNNLRTVLDECQPATMGSQFEAILMGLQELDKGDPYIRLIDRRGFSTPIEKFEIIGIGHRYIRMLFKLFYDPNLKVNELAILGYFCIATLISLNLDDNVGTG
jgi:20S proteasome alpha/beta subunit